MPSADGAEDVALHGDAVAVPADHLHHRLDAHLHQERGDGHAGHADHGRLVVGDVHRVHRAAQQLRLLAHELHVGARGGPELRGDGEVTRGEHLLQIAAGLHVASSSSFSYRPS